MKNMTRGILLLFAVFVTSAIYGGQPASGVAGVDVFVKQNPAKRVSTDARGNFALDALPPGPCKLTFRAKKAQDIKTTTTDKVAVASTYAIKIEGTKRPVNQSGLTSAKLVAGMDITVEVGPGAKIRGQVLGSGLQKMVWIPKEPGSQIPGHWADASSAEAKARQGNTQILSPEEMLDKMNRGNPNQTDPAEPLGNMPQVSGR